MAIRHHKKMSKKKSADSYGTLKAVLVSSNEDIIICKDFCKKCFESKLNIDVLHVYDVSKEDAKEFTKLKCRAVGITNCGHGKNDR